MTITAATVIEIAALLAALTGIGKALASIYEFIRHNREQDEKIEDIQKQQTEILHEMALIIDGVHATLDGLEQQGCNHTVPATKKKILDHINKKAHEN